MAEMPGLNILAGTRVLSFTHCRAAVRRPPPMPGQHTEEILRDLGYADAEIRRLRDRQVV